MHLMFEFTSFSLISFPSLFYYSFICKFLEFPSELNSKDDKILKLKSLFIIFIIWKELVFSTFYYVRFPINWMALFSRFIIFFINFDRFICFCCNQA